MDVKTIADKTSEYYQAYGNAISEGTNQRTFNYGQQWGEAERRRLDNNNIPPLVQNEISKHQKAQLAEFADNTPQPQVLPSDPDTPPRLVEAYQAIIRHVCDKSKQKGVFESAYEDALRTGCGGFVYVYTDYADDHSFKKDIYMKYADYTSGFFDPNANLITRADAEYCGYFQNISKDKFKKDYPSADPVSALNPFEGYLKYNPYTDDEVILCHYFEKDYFKTTIYLTNLNRVVEKGEKLEKGEQIVKERVVVDYEIKGYICNANDIIGEMNFPIKRLPVVYVSGYQSIQNGIITPYSFGYDVQDAQRFKNIVISQLASMVLNMRKETHLWDKNTVTKETINALKNPLKQQGAFLFDSKLGLPPTVLPAPQLSTTLIEVYSGLTQQIDSTLGRYEAVQGASSGQNISGVAEQLRINQGNINSYFYTKNVIASLNQISLILGDLIPLTYIEERTLYIKDKAVKLNNLDDDEDKVIDIGGIRSEDFQITIKAGASFEVQRQQYLDTLIQLVKQLPQPAQIVLLPEILNLMQLPNIGDITTKLENLLNLENPELYQIIKGATAEEIKASKTNQGPSPQQQAMQAQQQAAQAATQQAQEELALKKVEIQQKQQTIDLQAQKQRMEEVKTYGDYQLQAERNDDSRAETESHLEASTLKSHAEIAKASMDLAKTAHSMRSSAPQR